MTKRQNNVRGAPTVNLMLEEFNRFCNLPYVEKINIDVPGGADWFSNETRLREHLEYAAKQIKEFRETKPIMLGPPNERYRPIRQDLKRAFRRAKVRGWLQFWKWRWN
jgi:hypothetical protein